MQQHFRLPYYFGCFLLIIAGFLSCKQAPKVKLSEAPVIPCPIETIDGESIFSLKDHAFIGYLNEQDSLRSTCQYLSDFLSGPTGYELPVKAVDGSGGKGGIVIQMSTNASLGNEGYELNISPEEVTISATTTAGAFYGIQTLRQLFPALIESSEVQEGPWILATGKIRDFPEYSYRGAMLDVARHFFDVEQVKKYIDFLAGYKLNVLHLHLTDDQGWRIEIKSWPKLTEHGGQTEVGGGEGGFYTQDQYKEIVDYAQARHIMIIPEIDMPSHTNAALASYAELNCDGKARELYSGTDVGFSTLCTDKEITYQFIDDVIRELASMTPGPYIHIGGDESHVTPLEDYIPFIERVEKIVVAHKKIMIGWDEIAHAKLDPSTIAQFWARRDNAILAVEQGCKVIMSPANRAYMDMKYDSTTSLGLHWAAYIEVDSAYLWDPSRFVDEISRKNILGVEAPLWSETITNMDDIEYLVFPRLPGYADIAWSANKHKGWASYKVRLGKQAPRFEAMNINYYKSKLVPWVQ